MNAHCSEKVICIKTFKEHTLSCKFVTVLVCRLHECLTEGLMLHSSCHGESAMRVSLLWDKFKRSE